jgi:hypothetical protein
MTKGHVNNPKSLGLGVSKNLHEGCIEGGELVLKDLIWGEGTKQIRFLGKTSKEDPKSYLDIP